MLVLAIETSCDETAVSLVYDQGDKVQVLAQKVSSQIEIHKPFGGVVPEIATRQHLKLLQPLVESLLEENQIGFDKIDAIGVTQGPGLSLALMIGMSFAKGLALAINKPFIGVNHMEGHLYSPFLAQNEFPKFPHLSLIISGGHTLLIHSKDRFVYEKIGTTVDDATGECFDKAAKLLKLPYPGGPEIEKHAKLGNPKAYDLPRPMMHSGDFQFSFSGLKTAVLVLLQKNPDILTSEEKINDVCASFQQAISDVLIHKTFAALKEFGLDTFTVSGGVSCNQTLRKAFEERAAAENMTCIFAPPKLSTDNASMIGAIALHRLMNGQKSDWNLEINPNLKLA
jgi:N6-L-threonylcarbamoyladenine synthase